MYNEFNTSKPPGETGEDTMSESKPSEEEQCPEILNANHDPSNVHVKKEHARPQKKPKIDNPKGDLKPAANSDNTDTTTAKAPLPLAPTLEAYLTDGGHLKYSIRPEWSCSIPNDPRILQTEYYRRACSPNPLTNDVVSPAAASRRHAYGGLTELYGWNLPGAQHHGVHWRHARHEDATHNLPSHRVDREGSIHEEDEIEEIRDMYRQVSRYRRPYLGYEQRIIIPCVRDRESTDNDQQQCDALVGCIHEDHAEHEEKVETAPSTSSSTTRAGKQRKYTNCTLYKCNNCKLLFRHAAAVTLHEESCTDSNWESCSICHAMRFRTGEQRLAHEASCERSGSYEFSDLPLANEEEDQERRVSLTYIVPTYVSIENIHENYLVLL